MSVDFRIIAPSEAAAVFDDPAYYEPTEPLGSLGEVRDWLSRRVASIHPNTDGVTYHIDIGNGSGQVSVRTAEAHGRPRDQCVPRDDHAVTTIFFMMYGDFDRAMIGECAARFHGTIFDHQSSEMLSPEEFLVRLRRS